MNLFGLKKSLKISIFLYVYQLFIIILYVLKWTTQVLSSNKCKRKVIEKPI